MKYGVLAVAILGACGGDDAAGDDRTDGAVDAPTDGCRTPSSRPCVR